MISVILRGILLKVLIFINLLVIMTIVASCNSTKYNEIEASLPDLNGKPDGTYRGNYSLSGTPVKATLDVTIQNNKITTIEIINHSCSPIGRKAEKITGAIIEKQNLDIDVITGATASSKAILKAVENALQ
jgi:uncharacterized protein with FMN-binding domain